MTDEKMPENEDIEIKVGDEIPFEDETAYKAEAQEADVIGELRNLGQQFAATMRAAWDSEERREFESEMREGVQTFANEIDKAFKDVAASDPAQKVKTEAEEIKTRAESGDVGRKARSSVAQGLRWFSDELTKVADTFTTSEKEPPAEKAPPAEDE